VECINSIVLHRRYATDRYRRVHLRPQMMLGFAWPVLNKKSEIA
jgi:hypothetical protein